MSEKAAEKIPVTVVIAPREHFDGYWCIGRKFPTGQTDVEVTPEELAQIRADQEKKLPIAVVEYSPAEMAARRAAAAERDAKAAQDAADEATALAEAKGKAAAKAKAAAEAAVQEAASRAKGAKGKGGDDSGDDAGDPKGKKK